MESDASHQLHASLFRESWTPMRSSPAATFWRSGRGRCTTATTSRYRLTMTAPIAMNPTSVRTGIPIDIDFLERIHPFARQQVSWGLGTRFSHVDDLEVVSGLTFLPNRRTDQLYTAFLQDEIAQGAGPLLADGGRQRSFARTLPVSVLSRNVRLMWTPSPNNAFYWAAFTHALRTPSDAEENFLPLRLQKPER